MNKIICFSFLIFSSFTFANVFSDSAPTNNEKGFHYGTLTVTVFSCVMDSQGICKYGSESLKHEIFARPSKNTGTKEGLLTSPLISGHFYVFETYKYGDYEYTITGLQGGGTIEVSYGSTTVRNWHPPADASKVVFERTSDDGSFMSLIFHFKRK